MQLRYKKLEKKMNFNTFLKIYKKWISNSVLFQNEYVYIFKNWNIDHDRIPLTLKDLNLVAFEMMLKDFISIYYVNHKYLSWRFN